MNFIQVPRNTYLILKDIYEVKKCKFTIHIIKLIKAFCYALSVQKNQNLIKVPIEHIEYKDLNTYRYRGHNLRTFLKNNSDILDIISQYFCVDYNRNFYLVCINVNRDYFYYNGKYKVSIEEFKKVKNFYDLLKLFTISSNDVIGILRRIGIEYSANSIGTIISRIKKSPIKFRPYKFRIPSKIYEDIFLYVKNLIKEHKNIAHIVKIISFAIHLAVENKFSLSYFNEGEINLLEKLFSHNLALFRGLIIFRSDYSIVVSKSFRDYWYNQIKNGNFVYIEISREES